MTTSTRGPFAEPPLTTSTRGPFAEPSHTTGAWGAWWRGWYRLLRVGGAPLARLALRPGFGNLVVLRVVGRRSGHERSLPLGLLTVGGRRYLGHPSGDTAWTLNLRAAASASIEAARVPRARVRAVLLGSGSERDAVVRATFRQHPFPGNAMYRLAARHVAATGIFFRLEPLSPAPAPAPEARPDGAPWASASLAPGVLPEPAVLAAADDAPPATPAPAARPPSGGPAVGGRG
ncbi:MAG: hypothetical protein M0T75_09755 [Chloroflexi bacterium]|nr:hypothetical protein [Chloroflexota bacterium]